MHATISHIWAALQQICFCYSGSSCNAIVPMVVRYITGTVIYEEPDKAMKDIAVLAVVMIALVAVEFVCNYFIATVGHNMVQRWKQI